jgi:hypothetical protein
MTDNLTMQSTTSILMERLERGQAEEAARQVSLLAETSAWFERVRQFREAEMQLMVLQDPTASDMRFHRAYLVQITAQGESLAIRAMLHGLPTNHSGISLGAIEAALESLSLTQAQWHSGMTETRKQDLVQEVLGEPKSKA